ncbi:hypothetical protein [Photobacterium carnosum]|uniref:hypothetical protein n=1 Tax=Photobacterium carnosum TaxID=2023717 RepID=UPI001E3AFE06|nr:hypothetical protein [Photobacterium carnosum]MCD9528299.1 hypothetical protein [Photobacterium carnosum]
MTVVINRKLSGLSWLLLDGNDRANALVVMLAMPSPVHFTLLKRPELKDSGFQRCTRSDKTGYT